MKVVYGYRVLDTGSAAISDTINSLSENIESASSTSLSSYYRLLTYGFKDGSAHPSWTTGTYWTVGVVAFYCN